VTSADILHIRPATVADLPGVLALYAQPCMDDDRVLPMQDAETIFARFGRYPDYTLYVAEIDRQMVGSFALLIMDNIGHLGAPSAVIEDVVVDPALHSRGIGQTMMAFAIERAREMRCYKLVLSSNAKCERAHAFYESLGFERHGYSFRILFEEAAA
jgi:GNAT superfamily N-acetyltransferase